MHFFTALFKKPIQDFNIYLLQCLKRGCCFYDFLLIQSLTLVGLKKSAIQIDEVGMYKLISVPDGFGLWLRHCALGV